MENVLQDILGQAGITLNGQNPFDIKVNDPQMFFDILRHQSIGAGEAYMQGMWDCEQLDELFYKVCQHKLYNELNSPWAGLYLNLKNSLFNQQTPEKSEEVAKLHYDLGNTLYEAMLGKSMAYTCGYWKEATNLDEAEFAKYELVCKKLMLKPGERVLEIGCGWGGLAKYIAEKYGCEVVAMDIGRQPADYAKQLCRGLPVEIYQCDYRSVDIYNPKGERFDKLVSVGVLEHVGYKNYRNFIILSRSLIKDNGIFLLHSIGGNVSKKYCDPWINKYIFPNGMLPSLHQMGGAFENQFIVEDLQNFGAYYDKTLLAWNKNLDEHWPELKSQYNETFHRMMRYYLLSCAGAFRARDMQLWQFVLTPKGMKNGYLSFR